MRIVETSVFTKRLLSLLIDDEYRKLQHVLVIRPEAGDIIKGSGGLRKFRWGETGRGKRGGVRVIYYWLKSKELILMLLIYSKKEQDDLNPQQLNLLKKIVEKELT
jgi:mRNA-degrading endonuclease RelE of RelBE toxin-antitoxin system